MDCIKFEAASCLIAYQDRLMKLKEIRKRHMRNHGWLSESTLTRFHGCFFCGEDVENPQVGWCLKNSTYAQLCHLCFFAFEQGTFCDIFHDYEDGWRNCDDCGKLVHCGCIMALKTFELNGTCGVTCKECITKNILMASQVDFPSYVPNPKDCFLLENSGSSTEVVTGKEHADTGSVKSLHDDLKNLDAAVIAENSQMSKCDLLFLFEKKLAPTDCDVKAGRFLVPKQCAEQYFPQFAGSQSMPLSIEDREGRSWLFVLRWWMYKKSRKYVLDGTRKCIEIMRWNVGDTMKFYRRVADGKFIFELQRTLAATPASNVPVPGDGVRNP